MHVGKVKVCIISCSHIFILTPLFDTSDKPRHPQALTLNLNVQYVGTYVVCYV